MPRAHPQLSPSQAEDFRQNSLVVARLLNNTAEEGQPVVLRRFVLFLTQLPDFAEYVGDELGALPRCQALLKSHPHISQLVKEALEKELSYESLSNLLPHVLKSTNLSPSSSGDVQAESNELDKDAQLIATKRAWEQPYIGNTPILLRQAIDDMNKKKKGAYSNYVPIVQSSGMGKSRLVDELARAVVTIPFNLRPSDESDGFPAPDSDMRRLLMFYSDESRQVLELRQLTFLKHLFTDVKDILDNVISRNPTGTLAAAFREELQQQRSEFYACLCEKTDAGFTHLTQKPPSMAAANAGAFADSNRATQNPTPPKHSEMTTKAVNAATELIKTIRAYLKSTEPESASEGRVQLAIYFDESHSLTMDKSSASRFSAFDCLCSVFSEFLGLDLFVLFLSTKSKISAHSPSKPRHTSSRVNSSPVERLQAPFVELPFDIWHAGPILTEGMHTLEKVCSVEFMIRFGRAMWWTRYVNGSATVKESIVDFARAKLTMSSVGQITSESDSAAVAVLSTRLHLSLDATRGSARAMSGGLVESHMHILYSVPGHREHLWTGSSSEPILAEAAARIMSNAPHKSIEYLRKACGQGLISNEDTGELMGRHLLTDAHDFAVKHLMPEFYGHFTQPIFLRHFLIALVGEEHTNKIFASKPDNGVNEDVPLADSELASARLNFTHWAEAGDDCLASDQAAWVAMGRCMAWIGHSAQEGTDLVIPLLLGDQNQKLHRYSMSAIFVQVKNRIDRRNFQVDAENQFKFFSDPSTDPSPPPDISKINSRPYLTIAMQLGVRRKAPSHDHNRPTSPSKLSTFGALPKKPCNHPRYTVIITGCSNLVYPHIAGPDKNVYAEVLASRDKLHEHPRKLEFRRAVVATKPLWSRSDAGIGSFSNIAFDPACARTHLQPTASTSGDVVEFEEDSVICGLSHRSYD